MSSKRNHKIRSRKTYRNRIQAANRFLCARHLSWFARKMMGL